MNLFETLKQFKKIQPDQTFSETSKRAVLAQPAPAQPWSVRRSIVRIFETGFAVTLTGFFVLLVTGAFSNSRLAPVQYSALDPSTLRAEAQAIDMQIQLANITYEGSSAESTTQTVKPAATTQAFSAAATIATSSSTSTPVNGTGTASTPTPTLTIDEALQSLLN